MVVWFIILWEFWKLILGYYPDCIGWSKQAKDWMEFRKPFSTYNSWGLTQWSILKILNEKDGNRCTKVAIQVLKFQDTGGASRANISILVWIYLNFLQSFSTWNCNKSMIYNFDKKDGSHVTNWGYYSYLEVLRFEWSKGAKDGILTWIFHTFQLET